MAEAYDKEAEPAPLTEEQLGRKERALRFRLWRLQRIKASEDELELARKRIGAEAIDLLRELGRPAMVTNPVTGEVQIGGIRADEVLTVDAQKLLYELVQHFKSQGLSEGQAEFEADTVWKECLKPPEVDTKDDGAYRKAVTQGRVPGHVAAKVSTFKPKAQYVSFTKPKRAQ